MSYPHDKEKIQYILLVYQPYNLVGHRFHLLHKLDKLVMVISRTHAIAKDTYLGPRPVRFDKTKGLRYTIPRSTSITKEKNLRTQIKRLPRFFWITCFSIMTLCSSAALSFFKAAFSASSRAIF